MDPGVPDLQCQLMQGVSTATMKASIADGASAMLHKMVQKMADIENG